MTQFETFKKALEAELENGDTEFAHQNADEILCQIALSASKGELTELQVGELIEDYNNIPKWFG